MKPKLPLANKEWPRSFTKRGRVRMAVKNHAKPPRPKTQKESIQERVLAAGCFLRSSKRPI